MKLGKNYRKAIQEFRERKKPLDELLSEIPIKIRISKEDTDRFWDTIEKRDKLAEEISRKYHLRLRFELEFLERRDIK